MEGRPKGQPHRVNNSVRLLSVDGTLPVNEFDDRSLRKGTRQVKRSEERLVSADAQAPQAGQQADGHGDGSAHLVRPQRPRWTQMGRQ